MDRWPDRGDNFFLVLARLRTVMIRSAFEARHIVSNTTFLAR